MESTWVGFDVEEKEKEESTIEKKKRTLCDFSFLNQNRLIIFSHMSHISKSKRKTGVDEN